MTNLKTELPEFNGQTGTSWPTFVWRIKALLKAKDLEELYEAAVGGDQTAWDAAVTAEKLKEWNGVTGHVLSRLSGEAEVLVRTKNATELHTILDVLQTKYNSRAASSRFNVLSSVLTGGRKKGETLDELVGRKSSEVNDNLGGAVTGQELILYGFAQALSPASKKIAAPSLAKSEGLEELVATLREHEGMKGKQSEHDEHALLAFAQTSQGQKALLGAGFASFHRGTLTLLLQQEVEAGILL
eukprot:g16001.t1